MNRATDPSRPQPDAPPTSCRAATDAEAFAPADARQHPSTPERPLRGRPPRGRPLSQHRWPGVSARALVALTAAGFRRWATYRQAMVAGAFTNIVFGTMLCAVLRATARSGNQPGGYDADQLTAYVWIGQGLMSVVWMWTWTELADRVSTGDVTTDLLRPVDPLAAYAAGDLGRFGQTVLSRMLPPLVVGVVFYHMALPTHPLAVPLFAVSLVLAWATSFAGRYLVNLSAFWLMDARGPTSLWMALTAMMSGSFFPLRFLPAWAHLLLWYGTPFPGMFQVPVDIAVQRSTGLAAVGSVALQLFWVAGLVLLCVRVQRRAVHTVVVQGG